RAGDRVDRQSGEQEHHGRADDDADQRVRTDDRVDEQVRGTTGRATHLRENLVDRLRVRAEQGCRGQHRGGNGDALGDRLGGVADRVQLRQDLHALAFLEVTGHLRDTLRVVR